VPKSVTTKINERWSIDSLNDQLTSGRGIRIFNIVDVYTRECVEQYINASISGRRVVQYLNSLKQERSISKALVCDNGTEFTSKAMFFWSHWAEDKATYYITWKTNVECICRAPKISSGVIV
jgi:putative transposase